MDPQFFATDPVAMATFEGAKITADATARAAWVQVGAALAAIVAGALAYLGAVRQVRLQERAHEVRAVAYRFRLSKIVDEYLGRIAAACSVAEQQLASFEANRGSVRITSFRITKPQTLHDENWEIHALLGRRAVVLILIVDDASRRLAELDREIGEDTVRTDAHFKAASLKPTGKTRGADDGYRPEKAIIDYAQALDRLRRALADLQQELTRPLRAGSWHTLLRSLHGERESRPVEVVAGRRVGI
jgi:hypothetical protein